MKRVALIFAVQLCCFEVVAQNVRDSVATEQVMAFPEREQGNKNDGMFHWFTFFDDFTSDINGWRYVDSTASRETRITEGMLTINVNKGFWTSGRRYKIDTNGDFEVAVWAKCLTGNTRTGFGIEFNASTNSNSHYTFMIAADGFFCVKRINKLGSGGRWEYLCYWHRSASINKGLIGNDLKVRLTDRQLYFLVNGEEVFHYPYEGTYGNYFGVCVEGTQHVAFDNFIMTAKRIGR